MIVAGENLVFWLGLVWMGLNIIEYGIEYLIRWCFYFTFFVVVFQGYRTFKTEINPLMQELKEMKADIVDSFMDKVNDLKAIDMFDDIKETLGDVTQNIVDEISGQSKEQM